MADNPPTIEQKQRAAERQHDFVNDLGKRLVEAATRDALEAIKIVFLLNGGAAVAVLTFISSISSRSTNHSALKPLLDSLYWFCAGLVLAGLTVFVAYLCNSLYSAHLLKQDKIWEYPYLRENASSKRQLKWATGLNIFGILFAVASLATFVRGVFLAAHGMVSLVP